MAEVYDVIIIGGGPSGLTAGLYAARSGLQTLLIEKAMPGGQIVNAEHVENYPGFPEGISGFDLSQLMLSQAKKFGLETLFAEVEWVSIPERQKLVKTDAADNWAKALIIAGGSDRNKLGVPGEQELLGRGVSYCATCDGAFFRDQAVAVVGGGDAAVTEALLLTKLAAKVILIHRRSQLRASRVLQERAFANQKMDFLWDTVVEAILGDEVVKTLDLRNVGTGERSTLEVSGVFIYVGLHPNTDYLKEVLPLDASGHVITNSRMETEIPGVFAAGDIRRDSARQAITAAGDGATAALSAEKFLSEMR